MFYAAFLHTNLPDFGVIVAPDREKARTAMRHVLKQFGMSSKSIQELTGKAFDTRLQGYDEVAIIAASKHSSTSATLGVPTGSTQDDVIDLIKSVEDQILSQVK